MQGINIAVIGCGYQTNKNMAPAMSKSDSFHIAGFYDINPANSEKLSNQYGAKQYNCIDEIINDPKLDAVYIATPTASHEELCILAAKSGKHILCEKSLAMNSEQVYNIFSACQQNSVVLQEGFMYQHHTQHQYVRDIINSNEIGVPITFFAWFGYPKFPDNDFRMKKEMGGGATFDAGAYVIHSARFFFQREPLKIFSSLDYNENGLDIHGSVLMDFGNGQTAQLAYGMDNFYKNRYSIWGTKGEVSLLRAYSIPEEHVPICRISQQGQNRDVQLKSCNHFVLELEQFFNRVEKKDFDNSECLKQANAITAVFKGECVAI